MVPMGWMDQLRIGYEERALSRLNKLARRPGHTSSLPAHLITGIDGEDAAFFFLRRKGLTVVARRWSAGTVAGDLDLVAWDGPLLCIIEVKTRTAHDITPAEPFAGWLAITCANCRRRQLHSSVSMCSASILCRERKRSSSISKGPSAGATGRITKTDNSIE